ncbi:hypothetical protein KM043_009337 [Ampulex compressa]|nr:hypothetical protein KM043_009337 [Ampulex compressa]
MQLPSRSLIFSGVFLGYIAYTIYTLSLLFVAPPCEEGRPCLTSFLSEKPQLELYIFSSVRRRPSEKEIVLVHTTPNFDYAQAHNFPVTLDIPEKTRQNGTLFLHIFLVPYSKRHVKTINELQTNPLAAYTSIEMTRYVTPEAEVYNLLDDKKLDTRKKRVNVMRAVTHIKSKVTFTVMTDDIKLPLYSSQMEHANPLRNIYRNTFLPIINCDFLQTRHHDLVRITPNNNTINVTVAYSPISLGTLRLTLHVEAAIQTLKNLGFSDKDVDDVKGIFVDTNIYLLGGTVFIAAVHLLFDFLAFKNDISFWKKKNSLVGLSIWTIIWRAFSQTVIFLYLLDEGSSLLVVIPATIGTIIELWKLKKILRPQLVYSDGLLPRIKFKQNSNVAEAKTREFDTESMRYLSYLLYPLVISGAIYFLLYHPHKSWYSWSINSLVNGVYAFGFLFMLPQLFVNYKLKSVAHLPWRAFMYKAFNTFIDDVFAFIITMPTAHRIACFRDDAVFLIYLYQRWMYPVDKSRVDNELAIEESVDSAMSNKKKN